MFDNFGMIQASVNPLIVFSWEGYSSTKLCIIEEARNIDVWGAQLKFVLPEPFPLPPTMSPVNVLCQPGLTLGQACYFTTSVWEFCFN